MNINRNILRTSGLDHRDAAVWLHLYKKSGSNVTQISKTIDLNRPAVYKSLRSLAEKGLVTETSRERRKTYMTTGVDKLVLWRKNNVDGWNHKIKTSKAGKNLLCEDIIVLYGDEIKNIWEEISQLKKGSVVYRYDGYESLEDVQKFIPSNWYEFVDDRNIDRFVITNEVLRSQEYKNKIECESTFLENGFNSFEQGVVIWIYGPKVAYIDVYSEKAYIVKNRAIAEYHKQLFLYTYKKLFKHNAHS